MAKFRQNHTKHKSSGGFVFRGLFVTVVLVAIMIFGFSKMMDKTSPVNDDTVNQQPESQIQNEDYIPSQNDQEFIEINKRSYLPEDKNSQTVHHTYYSLGYQEETEQANWVAYKLTKSSLRAKNVKRERYFKPDYSVSTRSAFFRDYKNSGYTKGHIAPAGDMAFNTRAMKESFFMSNISPQLRQFNNGVWKELEENVRDWAYTKDALVVVSGPLFYDNDFKKIGQNRVGVPDAFYKILLDETKASKHDAIAYIIPHKSTDLPLSEFATTIDEVEKHTSIDFFYRYFENDAEEKSAEEQINLNNWPVNEKRYNARVNIWNKEK